MLLQVCLIILSWLYALNSSWLVVFLAQCSFGTKLWQIWVPIGGSSSRWLSKLRYLSQVKACYWKPLIVYTRFTIFSLTGVCLSTYDTAATYLYKRVLNEIEQTQSTNCKSRLLMCQLKYLNTWLLFKVIFNIQ